MSIRAFLNGWTFTVVVAIIAVLILINEKPRKYITNLLVTNVNKVMDLIGTSPDETNQ